MVATEGRKSVKSESDSHAAHGAVGKYSSAKSELESEIGE